MSEVALQILYLQFPLIEKEVINSVYHDHGQQDLNETIQMLQVIQNSIKDDQSYDQIVDGTPVIGIQPQQMEEEKSSLMDDEPMNEVKDGPQEQIVPKEMPPSISCSDSLFREILLFMRVQLKSDIVFFQNIKILNTILANIVNDPTNPKFQRLRLSNEKIKKAILQCDQSQFILEMLGFQKCRLRPEEGMDEEDYYVLIEGQVDIREFNILISIMEDIFKLNNLTPLTRYMQKADTPQEKKPVVPINYKKQAQIDKIKNQDSIIKNKLQAAHQDRTLRQQFAPEIYHDQRQQMDKNSQLDSYLDQLKFYRDSQKNKYRSNFQGRVFTTEDLQQKIDEETRMKNNAQSAGKGDSERLGIRSLELTNNFRKAHGLPALSWNQKLHDIAMEHSKNMAEGRVPVGHDGFQDRMRKVPFFVRSFSENVAYNYNVGDPVEVAVNGWINSPGHRKNMLSNSNLCGIAVYRHYGRYYFTQLFALA